MQPQTLFLWPLNLACLSAIRHLFFLFSVLSPVHKCFHSAYPVFLKVIFFKLSHKFSFLSLSHWVSQEPTTVGLSYSCLSCCLLKPLLSLLQVQHSLKIFFLLLPTALYKSHFHTVIYLSYLIQHIRLKFLLT